MFARRLAVIAGAILVPLTLAGEEQGSGERVVELPSEWSVGTSFEVTVEKRRLDYQGDEVVRDQQSTSKIDVEVVAASDQGYRLRWTFGEVELPATAGAEGAVLVEVARIMEGAVLDLRTDEFGTVSGLENEAEVRRRMEELMEVVLAGSELDEQAAKQASATMKEMLAGPGLAALVLKEPMLFTFPAGGTFVLAEEQSFQDSLPFPFTGESIPSEASFLLEEVDDEHGTAVVLWRQTLDPEKSAEVIQRFVSQTVEKAGGELPPELADFEFDIRDEARFVYGLSTGIPRSVDWSRTLRTGSTRRVDSLRFTTGAVSVPKD